jgi:hypothetical protein
VPYQPPLRVEDVEQLLRVHLLGGREHHHLEQLGCALQELVHVGPHADVHHVLSAVEQHGKVEVGGL